MSEKYIVPEPDSLGSVEGLEEPKFETEEKLEKEGLKNVFAGKFSNPALEAKILAASEHPQIIDIRRVTGVEIIEPYRIGQSASPLIHSVERALSDYNAGSDLEVDRALSSFKDNIIVDIGAGIETVAYELAIKLGASAYIAVEPNYSDGLFKELEETKREKGLDLPFVVVKSDGLSFVKCLNDESVNLMMVATDDYMFPDREYNKKLNSEILRVLGKSRGSIEFCSAIGPGYWNMKHVEIETELGMPLDITYGLK